MNNPMFLRSNKACRQCSPESQHVGFPNKFPTKQNTAQERVHTPL